MRRPRSHVLEEESWRAFQNALPAEWVIRRQNPDYAIDAEVEIFCDGKLTPFSFRIQLKATDAAVSKRSGIKHAFRTDHLQHYLSLPVPVMLAAYSSVDKGIYFEWAHLAWEDVPGKQRWRWFLQKTVIVKLQRRLSRGSSNAILVAVKQYFYAKGWRPPGRDSFVLAFESDYQDNVRSQQLAMLRELLSQFDYISVVTAGTADATLVIHSNPSSLEVRVIGSETFPLEEELASEESWNRLWPTVLLWIALILYGSGRVDSALDMVAYVVRFTDQLPKSAFPLLFEPSLAKLFAEQHREIEALALAERLFDLGHLSEATTLAGVLVYSEQRPFHEQSYRRLIGKMLETAHDPRFQAGLHYDMAGSLFRSGELRLAVRHQHLAVRAFPDYAQRVFWVKGLAHALLQAGRYRMAERLYRQLIDAGECCPIAHVWLSKALLCQGRIKEAEDALQEYPVSGDRPAVSSVHLQWLFACIEGELGHHDFCRDRDQSKKMLTGVKLPFIEYREMIDEAIRADPLNGQAWFLKAETMGDVDCDNSFAYSMVAAILLENNAEAWAIAVARMWKSFHDTQDDYDDDGKEVLSQVLMAALLHGRSLVGDSFAEMAARPYAPHGSDVQEKVQQAFTMLLEKAEHIFIFEDSSAFYIDEEDGAWLAPD